MQEIELSERQQLIYSEIVWEAIGPQMMDVGLDALLISEDPNRKIPPRTERTKYEQMFHIMFPTLQQQVVFGTGKGGYEKYWSKKYTADFYDSKEKIDYEIDGPEHESGKHYLKDKIRDIALWQLYGISVCRYTNKQIDDMVKKRIIEVFPDEEVKKCRN